MGPLLASDYSQRIDADLFGELWRGIQNLLAAHPRLGFDLVRLEKMPATVGAQANPFLALSTTQHPSGAYLTPLAPTWDVFYMAKRSGSTRRRDRSKRKALEVLGAVRFVEPASELERLASVDTLMQQKAKSFARMGVGDLFARTGHAEFYRAISGTPIAHVGRLDVGEHPAPINLGLMARGRYYHLLASYTDDAKIARLGPGAAHLMEVMMHSIRHGHTLFDFTISDEPYMRDWCKGRETLYDHLSARTQVGALTVAIRGAAMPHEARHQGNSRAVECLLQCPGCRRMCLAEKRQGLTQTGERNTFGRPRARIALRPTARIDTRQEFADHTIEQVRLFQIHNMTRLGHHHQSRDRQCLFEEKARLDAAVVFIADDDQGRRGKFPNLVFEVVERRPPALKTA